MVPLLAIILLIVTTIATKVTDPQRTEISVTISSDGKYTVKTGLDSSADVEAIFIDGMNVTGWGILEIKTNPKKHSYTTSDSQLMFAAGLAEGYLTSLRIYQAFHNLVDGGIYANGPTPQLEKFMNNQTNYMNMMIKNNPTDPFWMVCSVQIQYIFCFFALLNMIMFHFVYSMQRDYKLNWKDYNMGII